MALDEEALELVLLDQTLLPGRAQTLRIRDLDALYEAIYLLRVRGAPAIGVAAAYGAYVLAARAGAKTVDELREALSGICAHLARSRPTAVNLTWALARMQERLERGAFESAEGALAALLEEARAIDQEDRESCYAIGEHGAGLLSDGFGVLTHCNAGALATSRLGTALAPIYVAHARGLKLKVYADETRPLLQGARLTAWELMRAGVDTTLLCDNMAASLFKEGRIQAVLVGCDRVAANGDAANKIGTLGVAVLAKHFGVPFYVCAPLSTIDLKCPSGGAIEIEQRPTREMTHMWYEKPMAPEGINVFNPAFDVTDAALITAFITPRGVITPPFDQNLANLFD